MGVRVTQFSCDDLDLLAPAGCVTYNTEPSGNIMSYNSGTSGELINDQKFSHCIKNQDGYCDVALTSNFTGPYVATACSDSDNADMNMGYDISYLLLPCSTHCLFFLIASLYSE